MMSSVALCSDLLLVYVELGVALGMLLHRSFHRQQWAAVMEELLYNTPCVDDDDDNGDDDDGYSSPLPTENWNTECDEYAAFIDHRRMWAAVLTELAMIRPLAREEKAQRPSKLLDRRGQSLPRLQFD